MQQEFNSDFEDDDEDNEEFEFEQIEDEKDVDAPEKDGGDILMHEDGGSGSKAA